MINIDTNLPEPDQPIAFVERKGIGHPDTLCDLAAERASRELSRLYLNETGHIQHHNLDKALLIAGNAEPAFNGGKVIAPMQLIIAGRATDQVNGQQLPVQDTIKDAATRAIQNAVRHLFPEDHCSISVQTEPGASELQSLTKQQVPLANDTSMGVG